MDPSGTTEAHSTAHMENADGSKFAEVGFVEYWNCLTGCAKAWVVFAEGNDGRTPPSSPDFGGDTTGYSISSGHWARFKVDNVTGTTKWDLYYKDDVVNGSYNLVAGPWDLKFSAGMAYGETGRRGSHTGAADHHVDLLYKNCDQIPCNWFSWGGNSPNSRFGGITGWFWEGTAPNEYEICNPSYCPS
jgi:hypothetical protein